MTNSSHAVKPLLFETFPTEYKGAKGRAKAAGLKLGEFNAAIRALKDRLGPDATDDQWRTGLAGLWAAAEPAPLQFPPQFNEGSKWDAHLLQSGYEAIVLAGKAPVSQAWQSGPITLDRIKAMRTAYPEARNTGLRTGKLVGIDIDVRNPEKTKSIIALAEQVLGETKLHRLGSKGMLLCYRNESPIRKISILTDADDKVEILGAGQQYVAFGIHPDTNKPYRWVREDEFGEVASPITVPFDALPCATPENLISFANKCAELLGTLGCGNPQVRTPYQGEKKTREASIEENSAANIGRAIEHLQNCVARGEVAIIGQFGNDTIYELACLLRDRFFLSYEKTESLMLEHWYPHCTPNTLVDECRAIISHAFEYAQNEAGAWAVPPVREAFKEALRDLSNDNEQERPNFTCDEPDGEGTRYFNGLAYRRVSDIKSEKIEWLWLHRIASGALNMIAGLPAEGKSTIALDLAARITRGGELPCGGGAVEKAAILILSAEDHEKQTIKPRLVAAGADVSQCFIVDAMVNEKDNLDKRLLSLASDLERICSLIEKLKRDGIVVKLIIIDPISAYVGEGDGHKNTQMRALLTPLSKSAEKHKFGVILISHYKKNAEGTNALYRVTDSLAFVASCRGVLLTEKERDDDGKETGRKLLLNGKPSLIPEGTPGLAYKMESTAIALDDGNDAGIPRIKWDGFVNITADEAMANKPGGGGTEKLDRAVDFLEVLLFGAPQRESEVRRRAFGQRITAATLRRAKKKLGIISTRDGALAAGGTWWWALPEGQRPEQAPTAPEPAPTVDDDLPPDNFGTMH
jgi:hypothetical protein